MNRPPKPRRAAEPALLVRVERRGPFGMSRHASTPVIAATAACGSPSFTSASPTRTARAPSPTKRLTSAGPKMPLSATLTRSSGMSGASRPKVSSWISSVFRLRALTPISCGAEGDRALGLGLVVHLDQHGQAELAGLVVQPAQGVVVERGDDEQRQVGAGGAGLDQLVAGDDEVLAQHRDVDGGADGAQVVEAAAEAALLGEHADRGGTAGGVLPRRGRPGRGCRRGRPCWGCAASPRRSRSTRAPAGAASGRAAGRRRPARPAGRPGRSAARAPRGRRARRRRCRRARTCGSPPDGHLCLASVSRGMKAASLGSVR